MDRAMLAEIEAAAHGPMDRGLRRPAAGIISLRVQCPHFGDGIFVDGNVMIDFRRPGSQAPADGAIPDLLENLVASTQGNGRNQTRGNETQPLDEKTTIRFESPLEKIMRHPTPPFLIRPVSSSDK